MVLSNIENALKNVYLNVMADELNTLDAFISKVEKTTRDVWGKEIRVPYLFQDGYVVAVEEIAGIYVKIEFSDKELRAAQSSASALVNIINDRIEGALRETKNHIIDAVYGEDTKFDSLSGKECYERSPFNGLKELFNTKEKTLYYVDRNQYGFNPQVKSIKKINVPEIEEIIGTLNPDIDFMICSPKVKREVREYFAKVKQNVETKQQGDKTFYMMLNGNVVIQTYKDMPDDEIWLVNSDDFKIQQLCDWLWLEDENNKILRASVDKPTYTAILVKYCNLMCHNVGGQIKIKIEGKHDKK